MIKFIYYRPFFNNLKIKKSHIFLSQYNSISYPLGLIKNPLCIESFIQLYHESINFCPLLIFFVCLDIFMELIITGIIPNNKNIGFLKTSVLINDYIELYIISSPFLSLYVISSGFYLMSFKN